MAAEERGSRSGDLFARLGARSQASLNAALGLWHTAGATLVIQLTPGKPPDMTVHTGPVTVSVDTWKMASTK